MGKTIGSVLVVFVLMVNSCALPTGNDPGNAPRVWTYSTSRDVTTTDSQVVQIDGSSYVMIINTHRYLLQFTAEIKVLGTTAKSILVYKQYEYHDDVVDLGHIVDQSNTLANSGTVSNQGQKLVMTYDHGLVDGVFVPLSPTQVQTFTLVAGTGALVLSPTGEVFTPGQDLAPEL